jgi:transposase
MWCTKKPRGAGAPQVKFGRAGREGVVIGATSVVQHARRHPQKYPWIIRLLARKPAKLVAVAVANKMARIAWAIMAKGGHYRAPELAAAA